MSGPTRGAESNKSWSARPVSAWLVRACIRVAPLALSFAVTRVVSPVLLHPTGWSGLAVFALQVAAIGTSTALLTSRACRSFLPLVSLLNLTLVFPDRAPSRLSLALRSGTLKQLQRRLVSDEMNSTATDQEAAEVLVELVTRLGRHERLTRGHTERVRAVTALIGEELGLSDHDRELLQWGAMAHDIGKLMVPADILNNNGRPTEEEWETLRRHPEEGARLLEPLAGWLGEWSLAASQHHERWDGTGYPAGIGGDDISLGGRIVAVADAYDVITSKRAYKKAMPPESARQEMVRCSGTQFDPTVVRALLSASVAKDRAGIGWFGWVAEVRGLAHLPAAVAQTTGVVATAAAVSVGAVGVSPKLEVAEAQYDTEDAAPAELPFVVSQDIAPTNGASETATRVEMPTTDSPLPLVDPSTTELDSEPTTSTTELATAGSLVTTTTAPTTTSATATTVLTTAATSTTAAPTTTSTTAAPTTTTAAATGPTATSDSASVEEEESVTINVLANDLPGDAPLDPASLRIVSGPSHAQSVSITGTYRIRYRAREWEGTDSLSYEICDTNGLCDTASVSIQVDDD